MLLKPTVSFYTPSETWIRSYLPQWVCHSRRFVYGGGAHACSSSCIRFAQPYQERNAVFHSSQLVIILLCQLSASSHDIGRTWNSAPCGPWSSFYAGYSRDSKALWVLLHWTCPRNWTYTFAFPWYFPSKVFPILSESKLSLSTLKLVVLLWPSNHRSNRVQSETEAASASSLTRKPDHHPYTLLSGASLPFCTALPFFSKF